MNRLIICIKEMFKFFKNFATGTTLFLLVSSSFGQIKLNLVDENISFKITSSTFSEIEINKNYAQDINGNFITTFGTMNILNNGNVSFDISLSIISTTTKNRVVTTKPIKNNEFRFYSVFSNTIPSYEKFDYDDILSSVTKLSSIETFAISNEPKNVKGYDVSSGSTRTLFFRLDLSTNIISTIANFYLTITVVSSEYASEQISAVEGGKVTIQDRLMLEIPAGSLTKDEIISVIEKPKNLFKLLNNTESTMVYEFFPKGIIFRKPVKLTYYYKNREVSSEDEDKLRVYYWDGHNWRYVGGEVNKTEKTVSCYISHFSVYGLFPAISIPNYKPLEKIITPALRDGINDVATFDGLMSENVSIKIFDITGRLIRTVEVLKDGNIWDGKDSNGNIVESGVYIYQFKYNDKQYSGTIIVAK